MKLNWHVVAARVQAEHPHWSWSQVCAFVARRRKSPPVTLPIEKKPVQLTFNACL